MISSDQLPILLIALGFLAAGVIFAILARRRGAKAREVTIGLAVIAAMALLTFLAYVVLPDWFRGPAVTLGLLGLALYALASLWPWRNLSPQERRLVVLAALSLVLVVMMAFLDLQR